LRNILTNFPPDFHCLHWLWDTCILWLYIKPRDICHDSMIVPKSEEDILDISSPYFLDSSEFNEAFGLEYGIKNHKYTLSDILKHGQSSFMSHINPDDVNKLFHSNVGKTFIDDSNVVNYDRTLKHPKLNLFHISVAVYYLRSKASYLYQATINYSVYLESKDEHKQFSTWLNFMSNHKEFKSCSSVIQLLSQVASFSFFSDQDSPESATTLVKYCDTSFDSILIAYYMWKMSISVTYKKEDTQTTILQVKRKKTSDSCLNSKRSK
jgi:hypothetical protein